MKTTNQTAKKALITGASKGLGKEFAIQAAKRGYNLFLVALPNSNVHRLGKEIEDSYGVRVTSYESDLTDFAQIKELASKINESGNLDLLINNAGCGGSGEFEKSTLDYIDLVLNLNVKATALLTRLLIPALKKPNGRSHVLNISSMAAFSPIGYKHVYPASKAFLLSFTLGLRQEFKNAGIIFSSVHPGPMLTNSDTSRRIIQQGFMARFCTLNTPEIAAISLNSALKGKAVIIPGFGNHCLYHLMKQLPSEWVLGLVTRSVQKEISMYQTTPQFAF
ncbi:MAG: SDR family NAD(P)-dependent oxidoreductase [Cyclobacteriaceae bacterium]|nr:SDR family NAD(P)-dependent oxidoreductase [Cyclobacteriaceae bacterium]